MKPDDWVHQHAGVGVRAGRIESVTDDKVFVRWIGASRALPYDRSRFEPFDDEVWKLTKEGERK